MPKVSEEYIQNKKATIIRAAYDLCIQKTISTVTMQDIIDATGFSQGGIYRFYRDIDEIFKDMLLAGFEPVFELMSPYVHFEIHSLDDLDGLTEEFKNRFLYGDATREFNLPEWFVPMVNALSESEREVVLKHAQSKLKSSIDDFLQKVKSGEFEIIENWDSHRGALIEDGEDLRYVYLPDLKELKTTPAAEQLKNMLEDFTKNV